MDKKDSKRLQKTRQKFNEFSKREMNKWKIKKENENKKEMEKSQNEEIDRINDKLEELREEYNRISRERGSAHKWAQIIEEQDFYLNCYQNRRDLKVKNRAQNTLNQFLKENMIKENEIKRNKEKEIEKRKQLMRSSLQKENIDKEDVKLLRRLQKLENAEKALRQLIDSKKELSHSEASIERNTERLFWPKPLISQQEFLHSSVGSHKNVAQNKSITDSNAINGNIRTDASIQTIHENKSDSNEFNAISIATQLYERLKLHKMTGREEKDKKVYRNVAINTTPLKTSDNVIVSNSIYEYSLPSSETSYLSLPTHQQISSNKATNTLLQFYKNKLLNKSPDSVSSKSTINLDSNLSLNMTPIEDTLDPLIVRINCLKELINRKVKESVPNNSVVENPNHNELDLLLSRGDCSQISSKSQIINCLSIIKESKTNENSNNDLVYDENEKVNPLSSVKDSFIDREDREEDAEVSSTSSSSFKTLHALTSSSRSSSFLDIESQQSDHENRHKRETLSSPQFQELSSNTDMDSIRSSIFNSEPTRDRNAFWREVFERAGIDLDDNQIANFLQTHQFESEASIESFSLSTFNSALHSHSTPKRHNSKDS